MAHVWKASLGPCLVFDSEGNQIETNDLYFYDCNPSHSIGTTPTDTMIMLVFGNILCITTLRSHSYWAAWINYSVTVVSVVFAAALSRHPFIAFPEFSAALFSILVYNLMESNSISLFRTMLELEATNRVKTAELKHFIGNVAHDLKVNNEDLLDSLLTSSSCQCTLNFCNNC